MDSNKSIPNYVFRSAKGLNKEIVTQISRKKNEPAWMLEFRLKALEIFESKPMPTWGADLSDLDPEDIYYYIKPIEDQHTEWSDVPDKIKQTFEKLGIPQAEQKFFIKI
jgi:Fe-S cluster assembly protein SufB